MKCTTLFAILLVISQSLLAQYYTTGDTMTDVALDGLNIRSSPSSEAAKISKLLNGERVIILDTISRVLDTISEFEGNWVKVKSENGSLQGYVFDAFISQFPLFKEMTVYDQKIYTNKTLTDTEFLSEILKVYTLLTFKAQGCESTYYNGSDGEGAHSFTIVNLEQKHKLIDHGYHEGGSTELELYNVRPSEAYYLTLNLLKFYTETVFTIDEKELRNAQYSNYECAVTGDRGCYVQIKRKGENIISIFFNSPCC